MVARPRRRTVVITLAAIVVVLAIVGTVVAVPGRVHDVVIEPASPMPTAARPTPTVAPRAFAADRHGTHPPPTAAGVRDRLGKLLGAKALGKRFGAYVVDPATGRVLLDRRGSAPATPASNAKLATAAAALEVVGPSARLTTTVVKQGGSIVLVGGGDPTLRGPGKHDDGVDYPKFASLAALAKKAAKELGSAAKVRVRVDDSLYSGRRTGPGWKPNYVPEGDVAPISALMVDEGRKDPDGGARVSDPAISAGDAFAAQLTKHGVKVRGKVRRTTAAKHARRLASVRSPSIAQLVEFGLLHSDNDIAEALARQVALAKGRPASFRGASAAVTAALARIGVRSGISLQDGSGLSVNDRVTPKALAGILRAAASDDHPELSALLSGLPVGGFSGTLTSRFTEHGATAGAGVVRAKTGTLNRVSSLSGYVQDRRGRLLVFSFIANGIPKTGTWKARIALDKLAARLSGCGCS